MKALLVLAGSPPPAELLRQEAAGADLVVCADHGAAHCAAAGVAIDLVVGDFDSLDKTLANDLRHQGIAFAVSPAEKDETDGQLALDKAMERGATEITVLGGTGGRIDHVLGNLQLILRAARRGVGATLLDGVSSVRAVTGPVTISGVPGRTVSLLPAGEGVAVRYLSGLQYGTTEPLALPLDCPMGVSNRMTAPTAAIEVDGWAYLIANDGQ